MLFPSRARERCREYSMSHAVPHARANIVKIMLCPRNATRAQHPSFFRDNSQEYREIEIALSISPMHPHTKSRTREKHRADFSRVPFYKVSRSPHKTTDHSTHELSIRLEGPKNVSYSRETRVVWDREQDGCAGEGSGQLNKFITRDAFQVFER